VVTSRFFTATSQRASCTFRPCNRGTVDPVPTRIRERARGAGEGAMARRLCRRARE
jgi:hypothetical protein